MQTQPLEEQELKQARDYAQAIVETAVPLVVLDEDLRVKTANGPFYKYFRVSAPETENRLVYELGDGQWNIPELRTLLAEVLTRHRPFKDFEVTHEFEIIGRRTLLLSGREVSSLSRSVLFINDITQQVASRSELRASEIRYRRLFEAARDGILMLNPDTRKITDANPFMSDLLGYTHDDLLGKELWEIGLLKDEEASRAAFRQLQDATFIRYENLPLQNKEGTRHEVEFVSNVYDEDGSKVIQCNIRDITERKRMQTALSDANHQLANHAAELERVVGERTIQLQKTIAELEGFSYSVSHDMRAPLRSMQSFAQLLMEEYSGNLDAQGVNYLDRIIRSAARLDRLIQDVLSYTRILNVKLPIEVIDLDRLVRDIAETFRNGQPIQPEIQIQGTLPEVEGNEALLGQCISNLLSNAVKFVSPGSVPHVEVTAEAVEGALVRVSFKDNGIGIDPKDQDRIFRLFERIHRVAEYDGTGIGLTIVRKAMDRMGARFGVDSALDKGSNFWIELKLRTK